jgi:hypothetical protein
MSCKPFQSGSAQTIQRFQQRFGNLKAVKQSGGAWCGVLNDPSFLVSDGIRGIRKRWLARVVGGGAAE